MGSFDYEGHRIGYDEYGEGERLLVLAHGLLMSRRMFEHLGPALAERGNRVVCVDLLGHGRSDQPEELRLYSMPQFARQVAGLLDHLGVERAVAGGTSLGANVALELAARRPERVEGLFIEMPVLDNALAAVAAIFSPILLGLRVGRAAVELTSRLASLVPRTNFLLDLGLDWARRRPGPSIAVLEGLLLGETAPSREDRHRIQKPALIVGMYAALADRCAAFAELSCAWYWRMTGPSSAHCIKLALSIVARARSNVSAGFAVTR